MNWGDIQTGFSALLNRRDATSAQKLSWLQNGIQKIQRELRCPAMEKTIVITIDSTYTAAGGLALPADFLELQYILNSQGQRVEKEDITTVFQLAKDIDFPRAYIRTGAVWKLGPTPGLADTLTLVYYANLPTLSLDSDTCALTQIAGDLFEYAGLVYAGDFFSDKRTDGWETRYNQIRDDLQGQADADELSGSAAVSPGIQWPDDHYDDF